MVGQPGANDIQRVRLPLGGGCLKFFCRVGCRHVARTGLLNHLIGQGASGQSDIERLKMRAALLVTDMLHVGWLAVGTSGPRNLETETGVWEQGGAAGTVLVLAWRQMLRCH